MSSEQRLILALGLTFGIILFWSVLSPPAAPPAVKPPPPSAETQLVSRSTSPDQTTHYRVGPIDVGVGVDRAGISSVDVDGAQLLAGGDPGLLLVNWVDPSTEALKFKTKWDGQTLISTATLDEFGTEITRTLSPAKGLQDYLLNGVVRIVNRSDEPRSFALKTTVYHPAAVKEAMDKRYQSGFAWVEGSAQRLPAKPRKPKRFAGPPLWITAQGKSHTLILQPHTPAGVFHVEHSESGVDTGWLELPETKLSPGTQTDWNFRLYAGPINLSLLEAAGMEQMVSFGAFSGVARFLLKFLDWGHAKLNNYGLSICLLSLAVWLPFSPLTWFGMKTSTQTMKKMTAIKPQETRIRKELAKNPQKMQQELMALYKQHGVNPAAGCLGCLPFLFQWPIYIALFQVLNRAPQLRGANFLWINDLSAPDALIRFPVSLPALGDSLNILPIAATVGMFFQQKLMQPPQTGMTDEQKMQQKMFKFFPILLLVFFYRLPSGFMLYWVVYSIFMAGQQFLIKRVSH